MFPRVWIKILLFDLKPVCLLATVILIISKLGDLINGQNSFFKDAFSFTLCVWIFACMQDCTTCLQCSWSPEEGVRQP